MSGILKLSVLYIMMSWIFSCHVHAQHSALYDLKTIQEIEINFPFTNWDQKLDSLKTADSDARLVASYVELNGIRFDSVGIRYKGNSTYNANRNKNPLNIKLDFIKESQQYDGFTTLKLSNGFMDPSFLREVLGYSITRQYLPASRANFIKVFVNGNYLGLYTNVEDISNDFLSSNYFSSDGAFFQCDRADKQIRLPSQCGNANPGSALRYSSPDSNCYMNSYEMESDHGWFSFLRLMQQLNQNPATIEKYLDVDRALWMLAINNVFVNLDSYSGSGHNYLMYENANQKYQCIPWDFNEFYGAFTNAGTGAQLNLEQMRKLDPLLHLNNPDRPLISKLLSNPSYQRRYLAHVKTIITELLNENAYADLGLELQQLISKAVIDDRNKFFHDTAFVQNLMSNYSITGGPNGGKSYPGLIPFSIDRARYLLSHPKISQQSPTFTKTLINIGTDETKTEVQFIIDPLFINSAKFFYRFHESESFQSMAILDDGIQDDGIPNNGLFGVKISYPKHKKLQYYYYLENNDMALLAPERAEYEFYTIEAQLNKINPGYLYVNELMSSNASYTKDESGEYDDWIELYNPTHDTISMAGVYLSDNPDNILKWNYPDTFIAPNSFLVIWADEDGKDPGLHANFKLSKSGETVYLSNYDSSLIDKLDLPTLNENVSFGRCDSKYISFSKPSIGLPNDCVVNSIQEQTKGASYVQPNPCSLSCKLFSDIEDQFSITIYDIKGALKTHVIIDRIYLSGLELNNFIHETGVYVVHLRSQKQNIVLKYIHF